DGRTPAGDAVRLLEKTPKNALRIPFLKAVFPDARFIYLHRDPRQVLPSMLEGWASGHFVMYPQLPGWPGPAWAFLLTPRWRGLAGQPLADLAPAQRLRATRELLDGLQALPRDDWTGVHYGRVVGAAQAAARGLAEWAGWGWDRELGPAVPLSRYTM